MSKGASCYPSSFILIASQEPSIPSRNCFDRGNLSGIAKCLAFCGFTPIPLKLSGDASVRLIPAIPWREFKVGSDFEGLGKLREIFAQEGTIGLAIKTGASSGLLVLDIDQPEKFEAFYPLEELVKEAPYVVRSKDPGHYHVGFSWEPEFTESKNFLEEAGFEIKSNGALVNFFTVLPEAQYKPLKLEPLRPMPWELKRKILALIAKQRDLIQKGDPELQKPKDLDPRKIIELVSELYQRGQRQYWVIYTAGYLRKLGFSFEEVKEALEEFLRAQGDEELGVRFAGIKHTYEEPLENIKGLTGLLDLGLSDEAYLRLKRLGKQKEWVPRVFTLRDILSLEIKEPSWLIPNLLPEGFSILGGRPKIGKSWLALQIALTCAQSGKKVVYFALEDTHKRLRDRLRKMGIQEIEEIINFIFFVYELPRIGRGGIRVLRYFIQTIKPTLIVIDPWIKIKPEVRGKDVFSEEYQALEVFKEFQKEGVSILLVHHTRKTQSEDPIDEILGSTGHTAVVDNILVLKRKRGSEKGALYIIPRDFEELDLGLRLENGWKIEGSAKEAMLAEEQRKIVEAIRTLEEIGEKPTIKAIAELVGKGKGAVKVALFDLAQKGVVFRKEKGVYSLLDIKRTNQTNQTNLTNLTNQANQPHPLLVSPTVSSVSSGYKNELTTLTQDFQGLQEMVSSVSSVSSISQNNIIGTPTPDHSRSKEEIKGTSSEEEEEMVYLFTPGQKRCSVCGWDVWGVKRRVYEEGKGEAQCLKCGKLGWFREFPRDKEVDEKNLPFLLYRLIPVEAKMVIRIDKDGKLEVEGGKVVNPDLFKKLLPKTKGQNPPSGGQALSLQPEKAQKDR